MAKLMKTVSATALVACMTLGLVTVSAAPALSAKHAATELETITRAKLQSRLDDFLDNDLGAALQNIGYLVGIAVILGFSSMFILKAVRTGAGIMTAVPGILFVSVAGALIINIKGTLVMFAYLIDLVIRFLNAIQGAL